MHACPLLQECQSQHWKGGHKAICKQSIAAKEMWAKAESSQPDIPEAYSKWAKKMKPCLTGELARAVYPYLGLD
ncbi:hypothetical protein FOA52_006641 [Chlamydomonas sp. UWO 241]|nr:hypothetical protein FOA52_006641 [Chlamydomonas sp. UWO 241]